MDWLLITQINGDPVQWRIYVYVHYEVSMSECFYFICSTPKCNNNWQDIPVYVPVAQFWLIFRTMKIQSNNIYQVNTDTVNFKLKKDTPYLALDGTLYSMYCFSFEKISRAI